MDFPDYPTEQERAARIEKFWRTVEAAKAVLKPGDRIRVTQCPGTKRWITFAGWDGHWMISKSGKSYYAASTIDRLNGEPVSFV
jgi:hypothetical protein